MMIRTVPITDDPPNDPPSIRHIKEQVIEDEPIAKGRGRSIRRIGKSLEH